MLSDTPSCSHIHHLINPSWDSRVHTLCWHQPGLHETLMLQDRGPRSSQLCETEPLGCILSREGVWKVMLGTARGLTSEMGMKNLKPQPQTPGFTPPFSTCRMAPSPSQVLLQGGHPWPKPQQSWALDIPFLLSTAPPGQRLENKAIVLLLLITGWGQQELTLCSTADGMVGLARRRGHFLGI